MDQMPNATILHRLGAHLRATQRVGANLLFPPACVLCNADIATVTERQLCRGCRRRLVDRARACRRCGATGKVDLDGSCISCIDEKLHFESVVRLGRYDGELRSAVLATKSPRHRTLAMALARELAHHELERMVAWQADALVPIPMHWTRRLWRGTNCPRTLAEQLATQLKLTLAEHLLVRSKRTRPQASLTANKRLANMRGAFRVRPHRDLPGARLILVDDIMTTGATVNEAAKVLNRAGATVVGVAVLARAEGV